MILKKARQLARVIRDVRDGAAVIPGVNVERLERLGPSS